MVRIPLLFVVVSLVSFQIFPARLARLHLSPRFHSFIFMFSLASSPIKDAHVSSSLTNKTRNYIECFTVKAFLGFQKQFVLLYVNWQAPAKLLPLLVPQAARSIPRLALPGWRWRPRAGARNW